MSSSFRSIDRSTHIKILMVSLVAVSVVVAVGMSARTTDFAAQPPNPVLRAGDPASIAAHDSSIIR
jgi:hypothetical protein